MVLPRLPLSFGRAAEVGDKGSCCCDAEPRPAAVVGRERGATASGLRFAMVVSTLVALAVDRVWLRLLQLLPGLSSRVGKSAVSKSVAMVAGTEVGATGGGGGGDEGGFCARCGI
jgi:hypothetical protein